MLNREGGIREQEPKKGANVLIQLKLMRHGERQGVKLLDIGRQITRQRARESGIAQKDFDAVKAIGSPADPNPDAPDNMGRALETAHIYAEEIAQNEKFNTRAREILNHQHILSKRPYDHLAVYNSFLPGNFADLSPEEKAAASKKSANRDC